MKLLDLRVSQAIGDYDPKLARFLASHINDANASISQLAMQALKCILKRGCECDLNLGCVILGTTTKMQLVSVTVRELLSWFLL